MNNHTPGPWRLGPRDENDNTLPILAGRDSPKRYHVASVSPQPHYADNQEANARFILSACNSHAALLAALEELVIANHGYPVNPADEADGVCRAALEQARAVLAKVKKGV